MPHGEKEAKKRNITSYSEEATFEVASRFLITPANTT